MGAGPDPGSGPMGLGGYEAAMGFEGFGHEAAAAENSGMRGFFSGLFGINFGVDPDMVGSQQAFSRGRVAGLVVGMVGNAMMGNFAQAAMKGYSLGQATGGTTGSTSSSGAVAGAGIGGADRLGMKKNEAQGDEGWRLAFKSIRQPEPEAAPVTPYTETKEYLGRQKLIGELKGEIDRLGSDLATLRAKRKELEPQVRKMVGRIPLVHTELKGQEAGKGPVKALSKEGRERMLMSHSIPERAKRRAAA